MKNPSRFLPFFFVLLTFIWIGCDNNDPDPGPEEELRVGRGATISTTLMATMSVQEIRSQLAQIGFPLVSQYALRVYKIVYETIDPSGAKTQASGAVLVPQQAPLALPILSYQHGTVARKTGVPSAGSGELALGIAFATTGYVTVMPDYLGLGDSPGLHPYVHAKSTATAVVDMLRAATDLVKAQDISWNNQLFLTGYSQGGQATMAAHQELETLHTSEFTVTASAPMAGPYDISGTMLNLMLSDQEQPSPYYLPYTMLAYNQIYNLYPSTSDYMKAPYDTTLPPLFDGTHGGDEINSQMPAVPIEIIKDDVAQAVADDPNHPVRQAMQDNDTYDWTPKAPIRLYHCAADQHVPAVNSQIALQTLQAKPGVQISLTDPNPSAGHVSCAGPSILDAKIWIDSLRN